MTKMGLIGLLITMISAMGRDKVRRRIAIFLYATM
jgi:hypothetical protein